LQNDADIFGAADHMCIGENNSAKRIKQETGAAGEVGSYLQHSILNALIYFDLRRNLSDGRSNDGG